MNKFPLERVLRKSASSAKTVVPTAFHLTLQNWQSAAVNTVLISKVWQIILLSAKWGGEVFVFLLPFSTLVA